MLTARTMGHSETGCVARGALILLVNEIEAPEISAYTVLFEYVSDGICSFEFFGSWFKSATRADPNQQSLKT